MFKYLNIKNGQKGFTLVEALVAIAIFAIVSSAIYSAYQSVIDITVASQLSATGLTVISNQLEVIRNIKYQDIGIQGGAPAGIIPGQQNINTSGFKFVLNTTVRNIDDPFDGVLGGVPNDIAPADYKLVELTLTCQNCPNFKPITTTTYVGPANLEGSSKNGDLFVNAIDASGNPIAQANVTVVNNAVNPAINITDVTNNNGQLQLVDIATSSLNYQVTITKAGYSTDKTYKPGDPPNPNPVKPHATVVSHQVTLLTLAIDRLSTQTLTTKNKFCQAVPAIHFTEQGAKLIGSGPNVLKYSVSDTTDVSGNRSTNLEWDNYTLQNTDANYDLAGTSFLSPFTVNPNSNFSVAWMLEPKNQSSLSVTAQDASGQRINDVSATLAKSGFSSQKYTGRNLTTDTDWSAGKYSAKSTNLEADSPVGQLTLKLINGKYASSSDEWLNSNTIDFGTSSTNFYNLSFTFSQPAQTSLKIQLATNNDNATWNFVGPDGTASTYYTVSDVQMNAIHNGNRYLRYQVILRTDNQAITPSISDLTVNFSSTCLPNGQTFFNGLSNGNYTLTLHKSGYQDMSVPVTISNGWQEYRATLSP